VVVEVVDPRGFVRDFVQAVLVINARQRFMAAGLVDVGGDFVVTALLQQAQAEHDLDI
jgi:hypothetical protein